MRILYCGVCCLLFLVTACAVAPTPTPTPLPTSIPPTARPQPTTPPPSAATPSPTLVPALVAITMPELAKQTYTAGEIVTTKVLTATDAYTTSLVSYTSNGIKITGLLNVPHGDGKYPAVVYVHGYVSPDQYTRGLEAQAHALELTKNGYITLVPDLRGYLESDHGANLFLSGWIADVINAGSALKKFPQVDAAHVGLWGHSMGGGIATRVMVVSDVFNAVVLYAPISSDNLDMFMDPFGGEETGVTQELVDGVIAALDNDTFEHDVSPRYYLDKTSAPVSIHVGTADTVTPAEWSAAIRDGLKQANKNVEMFEYTNEGHSFQGDAVTVFNGRVLDFFNKYLK